MTTPTEASSSSARVTNNDSGTCSVAYLGPDGTYGQQAARQFTTSHSKLRDHEFRWIPCPTITDAYNALADYTVLPLENTIFGPVTETLDCFFTSLDPATQTVDFDSVSGPSRSLEANGTDRKGKGKQKTIIASLDLPIQHCLVVRKGTRLEDIHWVRSHEQALGQSSTFLKRHLPRAKRIPTASTALAAQSLLLNSTDEGLGAAICSRSVVDLQPDIFEVLYEGTQDRKDNHTRFLLLSSHEPDSLDHLEDKRPDPTIPNSSISESRSRFYILPSPDHISDLLRIPGGTIASLHSRPIIPRDSADKRRYPCGVWIEITTKGFQAVEKPAHEIICLGSAGGMTYRPRYRAVYDVEGAFPRIPIAEILVQALEYNAPLTDLMGEREEYRQGHVVL